MGVLIQPVLCITSIKVCHPSPRVCCVQRWYSTSNHHSCSSNSLSFNVVECPIPFQSIDDSLAEENEGCKPILATSRCCRSQHPPLSADYQESYGFFNHRAKVEFFQPCQARSQHSESSLPQRR